MANELKFETGVDLRGNKGINVGDPSVGTDAVNLQTLMNFLRGITSVKDAARVATTTNISISSAPSAVDGVTLVNGDRVLLKNQSSGLENGIRVFTAAGAALLRSVDADSSAEVKGGLTLFVNEGTANGNSTWQLTTDDPIVLDTTVLVFSQIGAPTVYIAGAGMDESPARTFNVTCTDGTITVTSDAIRVTYGVVARIFKILTHASTTTIDIAHALATSCPETVVRVTATGERIFPGETIVDANTVRFYFSTAPGSNTLTFAIHG